MNAPVVSEQAPEQDSASVTDGSGRSLKLNGKTALRLVFILIIFIVGLILYYEKNISNAYNRWDKPVYYQQYDKLIQHHPIVKNVVDEWDKISDIDDTTKDTVKNVRKTIFDALKRYENMETDKLDISMQIIWLWHLSKLKIIEADITSNIRNITKAIAYLEQAEEKSANISKLTKKDVTVLNNNEINRRILRTQLNAYALAYYISKNTEYQDKAMAVLKMVGGCSVLHQTDLYHIKISNTLNCNKTK